MENYLLMKMNKLHLHKAGNGIKQKMQKNIYRMTSFI